MKITLTRRPHAHPLDFDWVLELPSRTPEEPPHTEQFSSLAEFRRLAPELLGVFLAPDMSPAVMVHEGENATTALLVYGEVSL